MSENADTNPGHEITIGDVYDVLGSLVLRVDALADAVRALTNEVAVLREHDRHFVRRVREAASHVELTD